MSAPTTPLCWFCLQPAAGDFTVPWGPWPLSVVWRRAAHAECFAQVSAYICTKSGGGETEMARAFVERIRAIQPSYEHEEDE